MAQAHRHHHQTLNGLLRNLVRLYFTNFELEIILLGQQGSRQEHIDMAAYGIVNIYAKSAFCTNYIRLIMTETETRYDIVRFKWKISCLAESIN